MIISCKNGDRWGAKLMLFMAFSLIISMLFFGGCNGDDDDDQPGTVSVDSSPQGASVFIDGDYQNRQTPAIFELEAGNYKITASLAGHIADPESVLVDLASGGNEDVFFEFTEDTSAGYVMVVTDPPGADIYLDDALFSYRTPYTVPASAGSHEIRVEKSGFEPKSEIVTVSAGVTSNLDFGNMTGQRMALVEDFTNVYCPNCPRATENINSVIESGYRDRVILIEYHPGEAGLYTLDVFYENNPAENNERFTGFYGVSGVPRIFVGGDLINNVTEEGGDILVANAIDACLAVPHDVDIWGDWADDKSVNIFIRGINSVNAKIYGIVYRKEVHFDEAPGSNGLTDFHHVMYDIFPEATERNISIGAGETQEFDFNFEIDDSLTTADEISIAVFVQDTDKNVYQAVELIHR